MTTAQIFIAILTAALTSPLISKFCSFIYSKMSKKKTQLDRIEHNTSILQEDVKNLKLETQRTNLLLLLADYRDNADIPLKAKEYVSAGGDSYIIPLVAKWYDDKAITKPEWLQIAIRDHCIDYDR